MAASNVSIEVNTVFQNLVGVLNQIDVGKLNAVLAALAEGFGGKGEAFGHAITDLNDVLLAINPRSGTIRSDFRALKRFSDALSPAAPNLVAILDALNKLISDGVYLQILTKWGVQAGAITNAVINGAVG